MLPKPLVPRNLELWQGRLHTYFLICQMAPSDAASVLPALQHVITHGNL